MAFQAGSIELATGKVAYMESGSDSPPVVLLHHSWGSSGETEFANLLAEDARVIVPDLPGWGASIRPVWARTVNDIAVLAGRILERLELENVTLIGAGFGGYVGAELACMNPSRIGNLVLIGSAGLQPESGEILDQMMLSHRKYIEESFLNSGLYHEHIGDEPPEDLRLLWDHSREMTARVAWKPYLFSRQLPHLLSDMHVPTLLIWGEQDKVVPVSVADQFLDLLPNAHKVVVRPAGHLVEIEQPVRVSDEVRAHVAASS